MDTTISIIICVEPKSKRNENTILFYLFTENHKLVKYYLKNEIHIAAHY